MKPTVKSMNELKDEIEQFQKLELPGQPPIMHMGTFYLIQDLWAKLEILEKNFAKFEGKLVLPMEPTVEMLRVLVRRKFPEDWEAGKLAQRQQISRGGLQIPFKTEYEIAYGQYCRLLEAATKAK